MKGNTHMKKNVISISVICILIILIIISGIAYARYVTTLHGQSKVDIAKQNFNYKILDNTQTKEVENFAITRNDDNKDVDSNTIAPRNQW